jgi:hypothetical protein
MAMLSGKFKGPLSRMSGAGVPRPGGGGPSFSFKVNNFKSWFFTNQDWEQVLAPAEKKALEWGGSLLKLRAKRLIQKRQTKKHGHSAPGEPPRRGERGLLYSRLFSGFDPWTTSVFVGPEFLTSPHKNVYCFPQPTIPATLEFGGKERVGFPSYSFATGRHLQKNRVVRIAPRPYMAPAEVATRAKRIELWRNILGKTAASQAVANAKRHRVA